jgi:DNA-binding FadR family transcriptional regulator
MNSETIKVPLRGPALNEAVRNYIKQYILEHGLNGGDPLPPETQLAQVLGVGRSSVREAIKALQSLGIVEVRRGNGLFVREYNFDPILETLSYGMRFDSTTLAELVQLRIWLEAAVVEEAVRRIGPQEIAQLETLMQTWADRVAKGEPCTDLDKQFHRTLYASLNNQTLMKFLEVFWIAFEKFDINNFHSPQPAITFEQHQAILDAIKAGDPALTRQRLIKHFNHLQEKIRLAV